MHDAGEKQRLGNAGGDRWGADRSEPRESPGSHRGECVAGAKGELGFSEGILSAVVDADGAASWRCFSRGPNRFGAADDPRGPETAEARRGGRHFPGGRIDGRKPVGAARSNGETRRVFAGGAVRLSGDSSGGFGNRPVGKNRPVVAGETRTALGHGRPADVGERSRENKNRSRGFRNETGSGIRPALRGNARGFRAAGDDRAVMTRTDYDNRIMSFTNWPQRKKRPRLEYLKWPSPVRRMMPEARLWSTCLRISSSMAFSISSGSGMRR